jgi:SAM-dependent methyltransferase
LQIALVNLEELVSTLDNQVAYWSTTGAGKTFSHPINFAWLDSLSNAQVHILDYGCGYGRTMHLLYEHGYHNLEGVDTASGMFARARQSYPDLTFTLIDSLPLPHMNDSFDVALLFAVLTCIPGDAAQQTLVRELFRTLKPGGLLYISDLLLQTDERNQARYHAFQEKYGTYGVFETGDGDGAVCRHHDRDWLHALVADFEPVYTDEMEVMTMNQHPVCAYQLLVQKPA